MKLHHFVGRLRRFGCFGDPSLHNGGALGGGVVEMRSGYQSRTGDEGRRIDEGLLDVSLDRTKNGCIYDTSQDTKGVSSVKIGITVHVLCETLDDDNNVVVFAGFGNVFDKEVDHSSQGSIVAHEQFGYTKEDFCSFRRIHVLPGVLKVKELCDDGTTLSGVFANHRWIVKDSGFLQDCRLFELGVGRNVLFIVLLEFLRQILYLSKHVKASFLTLSHCFY
mmetsp:Transcript_9826/g.24492  ORF Transcript_9826/g.24492 Transcript_9826/m.24492 type:complete len:221 (+) Transcript_9826:2425-3087(+)